MSKFAVGIESSPIQNAATCRNVGGHRDTAALFLRQFRIEVKRIGIAIARANSRTLLHSIGIVKGLPVLPITLRSAIVYEPRYERFALKMMRYHDEEASDKRHSKSQIVISSWGRCLRVLQMPSRRVCLTDSRQHGLVLEVDVDP